MAEQGLNVGGGGAARRPPTQVGRDDVARALEARAVGPALAAVPAAFDSAAASGGRPLRLSGRRSRRGLASGSCP